MKYFQSAVYKTKKARTKILSVLFAQTQPFQQNVEFTRGDVATIKGFERIFGNIVVVILEIAGLALFIMLIIGGFKYMNSQGDPKELDAARGTLTHAIIGLVVLALAFVFLVIIKEVTGVDITQFKVTK